VIAATHHLMVANRGLRLYRYGRETSSLKFASSRSSSGDKSDPRYNSQIEFEPVCAIAAQ